MVPRFCVRGTGVKVKNNQNLFTQSINLSSIVRCDICNSNLQEAGSKRDDVIYFIDVSIDDQGGGYGIGWGEAHVTKVGLWNRVGENHVTNVGVIGRGLLM